MCESQVTGCQLLAWPVTNAQWMPAKVRPAWTVGLLVT